MGGSHGKQMQDTVADLFAKWGSGEFAKDADKSLAKEYMTDDVVIDASSLTKKTNIYKVYHGIAGFYEWLEALTTFDFTKFEPLILPCKENDNRVFVRVSASITKKSNKKEGSFDDVQEWTFTDGKISKVKFYFGDETQLDSLFDDSNATSVVSEVFSSWGQGKFSGEGREELAASLFHENVTLDAVSPAKNTDGFKHYEGVKGFLEWIDFLTSFEFKNFVPTFHDAKGSVLVKCNYQVSLKSTGKSIDNGVTDISEWVVSDGKISSVKFCWGASAEYDQLFVTDSGENSALTAVQNMFQAWGSGQWATGDRKALAAKYFAADCVTDAAVPMQNTDMYRLYNGHDGVNEWIKNLEDLEFIEFTPTFTAHGKNQVLATATYGAKHKGTGKSLEKKVTDTHIWTVNDEGKISHVKFFWADPAGIDAIFGHNAVAIVGSCFQLWGEGKWASSNDTKDLLEKYVAKDGVWDSSAPFKNTDIYSKYEGHEGWSQWIKNLEQVEFIEFTPTFTAHGKNQVLVTATYGAKHKETGKSLEKKVTDTHIWTVNDEGKISAAKFYWSDIEALDAIYA